MKTVPHSPVATRPRAALLAALVSVGLLLLPLAVAHAATAVPLGTAQSFAILAGSTITNTGQSTVTGDIGLDPGSSVTGYGPGADAIDHDGSLHIKDGAALQAKNDLTTAYTNAAGQTPVTRIDTELGTAILKPGVYDSASGTFEVTGALTLDAEGNSDAVFIFQMRSSLTTATPSSVNLINGASACNVFWQVGSSATLGTDSVFRGTIMADQSITLNTGATLEGRAFARSAAVTLDSNTITNAACVPPDGDGSDGDTDTTSGDGSSGQVEDVPTGPVDTGGGELDTNPSALSLLLVASLLLVGVGAALGLAARRHVRAEDA